ncbi:MAG: aldose 1-epimerase family protein [Actinomycetes bacterium]
MTTLPPSGRQLELRHGGQAATVVTVSGGLRTFTVDGREVFDGYGLDAMPDGGRGQTLIPWPNRVRDGKWTWRGKGRQLPLTEPAQHNAIHGLVRWLEWDVIEHDESTAVMGVTVAPQTGYEWRLGVRVRYSLADDGLTVEQSITNLSSSDAPVAAGAHPYITVGTPTVNDALLHLPADTYLPTGDQQIPTGTADVSDTPYDFREPRPIGDLEIDYAFTDLHRDPDGCFRLRLSHDGREVVLWVDESYPYVEAFTGDTLAEGRRRRGLGVEPMSAPPNAFATGESVVVLGPDETWTGHWGIASG